MRSRRSYPDGVAADADDWAVLGVPPESPLEAARAAYVQRAHLLHPDRHPNATPAERERLNAAMAALNLAWERIEVRAATARPTAGRSSGHGADQQPDGPATRATRAAHGAWPDAAAVASIPDGFLPSPMLRRPERWSLRLWTDDPEPLYLLCHHRAASTVGALDLHRRPICDRHMPLLRHLSALEMLDLSDTRITDAGLRWLTSLPVLRDLALAGTAITDQGLDLVARCERIMSLNLCDTAVTDGGVEALGALPLTTLNLRGTRVEGPAFEAMTRWSRLRLLAAPRVDREIRQRFMRARPDVSVV